MWPGLVPLESTSVQPVANVGTSLSTAQNVQLPYPLTVLCTCGKATLKIFIASAILRGIVTTFTKERCAWDFGLVTVRVTHLVTPSRAGNLFPGSSLKKFLKLRVCLKTPHLYTVIANVRYIKILSQLRGFRVKIALSRNSQKRLEHTENHKRQVVKPWSCMFSQLFSPIKVKVVDKMMQSAYLCVILFVKYKKLALLRF